MLFFPSLLLLLRRRWPCTLPGESLPFPLTANVQHQMHKSRTLSLFRSQAFFFLNYVAWLSPLLSFYPHYKPSTSRKQWRMEGTTIHGCMRIVYKEKKNLICSTWRAFVHTPAHTHIKRQRYFASLKSNEEEPKNTIETACWSAYREEQMGKETQARMRVERETTALCTLRSCSTSLHLYVAE